MSIQSSVQTEQLLHQPHRRLTDWVMRRQLLLSTRWLHKIPAGEERVSSSRRSWLTMETWGVLMSKEQQHKPELLGELWAEVLGELVVVAQAGHQEATALVQQDSLSRAQEGLLQVWQDQDHLLHLVPKEGQLQRQEDRCGLNFRCTDN